MRDNLHRAVVSGIFLLALIAGFGAGTREALAGAGSCGATVPTGLDCSTGEITYQQCGANERAYTADTQTGRNCRQSPDDYFYANWGYCQADASCSIPKPTVSISANPTSIVKGAATAISWSSQNASSCAISGGGIYSQDASGSTGDSPQSDTTYTITCTNANGSATATANVAVTAPNTQVSCQVSPTSTGANQNVTWTATAWGGLAPYAFSWAGDEMVNLTGSSVTLSYPTNGTKHAQVKASDSTQSPSSSSLSFTTNDASTCTGTDTGVVYPDTEDGGTDSSAESIGHDMLYDAVQPGQCGELHIERRPTRMANYYYIHVHIFNGTGTRSSSSGDYSSNYGTPACPQGPSGDNSGCVSDYFVGTGTYQTVNTPATVPSTATNACINSVTVQNQDPQGNVDSTGCTISGWAFDPDTKNTGIRVDLYANGPAGGGGTGMGSVTTSIDRSDVQSIYQAPNAGWNFAVPAQFQDGQAHTLYAYAIDSSGGNNPQLKYSPTNSYSMSFTCAAPKPDLTATTDSSPSITTGNKATLTGTVKNGGAATTGTSFKNLFQVFQSNASAGDYSVPLDNVMPVANTLAPNASQALSGTTNVSFNTAGTYYYRLCADYSLDNPASTIAESDEGNNCGAWNAITVSDPVPQPPTNLSYSCNTAGNQVTLSWTAPTYATKYYPRITVANGSECPAGWQIYTDGTTCFPNPDGIAATHVDNFPIVQGRTYTWWVHGGDAAGLSTLASGTFSCAAQVPDLTATTGAGSSITAGGSAALAGTIQNIGNATAGGSFNNLFQITAADQATVVGNVVKTAGPIAANGSQAISGSFAFNTPGTYYYRACADLDASWSGSVAEANEGNNCGAWSTVTVAAPAQPDLTSTVGGVVTTTVGQSSAYTGTTYNNGTAATGQYYDLFIFYQADQSSWDSYQFTPLNGVLGAGGHEARSVAHTFNTAGTYYYRLCADWNGNVSESNEDNNCSALQTVTVNPAIPAAPTDLKYSCNAAGTQATLSWTAPANASSYYVRLDDWANNSPSCQPDGWYCGNPPDAITDGYGQTSITYNVTPGQGYGWWVHAGNVSGIGDPTTSSFVCAGQPDLTADTATPVTVAPGQQVTFTGTARNLSTTGTTGGDGFWNVLQICDGSAGASGGVGGNCSSFQDTNNYWYAGNLGPGASAALSYTYTVPASLAVGAGDAAAALARAPESRLHQLLARALHPFTPATALAAANQTYYYRWCSDWNVTSGNWVATVDQSDFGNDCGGWGAITVSQPDLTPVSLTPSTVVAGDPSTFTATLRNNGGAATPSFSSTIFVCPSSDSSCVNNSMALADHGLWQQVLSLVRSVAEAATSQKVTLTGDPIAGGSTGTQTGTHTFSSAGTYTMRLCADLPLNQVNEANEDDNCGDWQVLAVCSPGSSIDGSGNCVPPTSSCTPDKTSVVTGETVTYTAGGAPGPYTWLDSDGVTGTGTTFTRTYTTPGSYSMQVKGLNTGYSYCSASNGGGAVQVSVTANYCFGGTPTVAITANPARVKKGQTSTVSWTATNVQGQGGYCTIIGPGVSQTAPAGPSPSCAIAASSASPTITTQSVYTINCGGTTAQTIVNVVPDPGEF